MILPKVTNPIKNLQGLSPVSFQMLFTDHSKVGLIIMACLILTAFLIAINIGFVYTQLNFNSTFTVLSQIGLAAIAMKLITNLPIAMKLPLKNF